MALNYRPDIDGLRSVAVLAVVFYHLGLPIHFDGYIGVDVFFVISGFLISGILYRDVAAGTFSLGRFYARRIKRILPALYCVVIISTLFGALVMIPEDLKELGKSAFSTIASASNIYFWYSEDTNYFARSSELLPLLHTWSLGVEEQFYFVWPTILFVIYRLSGYRGLVIASAIIATASYCYAELLISTDPSFSYYMLPTRAGELLTGAFAYFGTVGSKSRRTSRVHYEIAAFVGAGLLVYALFFADSSMSFPGFSAIYPCLGTAIIIFVGSYHTTFVSRILSVPLFVAIGLISYSLYLWHWPVLAYARYLYTDLSPLLMVECIVIMTVASILSYRLVEVPFRALKVSNRGLLTNYVIVPIVLLVPATLFLYASDGMQSYVAQNPDYLAALEARKQYASPAYSYDYVCQTDEHGDATFLGERCLIGDPKGATRALLWGDSHAAHHVGYLAVVAETLGFSIRNLEMGSCPPVLRPDITYARASSLVACADFRKRVQSVLANYEYVVLGGAWNGYANGDGFEADVKATVSYLVENGRKVILLGQIPRFINYDRNCQLRNARYFTVACEEHAGEGVIREFPENDLLKELAAAYAEVTYFDVAEFVCDPRCNPYRNGKPIYFNGSHLSIYGSRLLGEQYSQRSSPFDAIEAQNIAN